MNGKIKRIISSLLLLVFLLPLIVKFEHHHTSSAYNNESGKHSLVLRYNCPICNFEFSFFLSDAGIIALQNDAPKDSYLNSYRTQNYSNLTKYSFSLRGPPDQQI
jgi:hypothetical protein